MPHIEVQPNGQMEFVRSSKHKPKAATKHKPDTRDQKMADLQRRLDEVEDQKEQLIIQYRSLKELQKQAIEDVKAFKQAAFKYKKDFEDIEDKYEDLHERFTRRGEEIKQKDKIIRQRDSEIRSKDKEIEDSRVDKKVQAGTIKQVEGRNAALQDRITTVSDEKRRLQQEVALRRANEEKLLAEHKKLKDENTRLLDWVAKERQLSLEKETRLRREREEIDRRENDRRAPPRRRYDDEFFR